MSYHDPYGGGGDARGWPRQDDPPGWHGPGGGGDAWSRARHGGAAPETYVDSTSHTNGWHPENGGFDRYNGEADPYPAPAGGGRYEPPGTYGYQPPGTYEEAETAFLPAVTDPPPPLPADPPPPRRHVGRRRAGRRPGGVPAAGEQPRTSRAGRNLPAAIGVGVALGALIVIPLFLFRPAFAGLIAAAVAVGVWELCRAVGASGTAPPVPPLVIGGVLMTGLAWWAGPDALCLGLLVTVLAAMVWRLADGPANYQRDVTAAALVAVYVPFLGGFAALLASAPDDGQWRILVTLVAVVLSDTGGYAAGVALGRHPMAPSVSPKKSWEGFAGSVLAAAGGSALLLWYLFEVEPWWGALFGMAVSIAAVLGDLGESMIKRDLGIKDMSNLLPGHGGLMDRLDSILFALPTAYLLLAVLAPVARP